MKRIRIELRGLTRAPCPCCAAPCWLHPELDVVHRVPLCRWFQMYERPSGRVDAGQGKAPAAAAG